MTTIDNRPLTSPVQALFQITYLDENRDSLFFCVSDITVQTKEAADRISELNQAKLAAERANEAKSSFLSSMSHDLRTPLNGILGFTDIAIREPDSAKKQDYLEKIKSSGQLLLALVNDTLELSRIESGKFVLENEPVDSYELGEAVLTALRPSADLKNIHLEAQNFPVETVMVDKLKLQKVLLNLLSNAIKYTPENGKIKMSIDLLDPPVYGCNHRIVVEDNGIGIKEDFLPRIFEPFSQENRPEACSVMGTGLGLSIVKKIVDMVNGKIEVQSKPGVGTRFTVYLPIESIEDAESNKEIYSDNFVSLNGCRVLLCEDNHLNAEIAKILLNEQGISVEWAEDGLTAVKKFKRSSPGYYDAILMDIRMPYMNGYEATKIIRKLQGYESNKIPIIAMTADAFDEDIKKTKKAGMDDFLSKPIQPAALISALRKNIQK